MRDRLWSSDTFVDFLTYGLNTAINQLRTSLGDSATNPRFIQTLLRRGYRFIAPVEIRVGPNLVSRAAENIPKNAERALLPMDERDQPDYGPSKESLLSDARDLPIVSEGVVRALFSLIQLMYLNFYIISLAHLRQAEAILFAFLKPTFLILTILIVTAAAGIPIWTLFTNRGSVQIPGIESEIPETFPNRFCAR